MLELLWSMMKEEWRLHAAMFGSFMFALFPVLIAVLTFVGCLFIPFFSEIMPTRQMVLLAHYVFVLFGLSIGAFGFLGREVMNRRFGKVSLVAFSSRTLPIKERKIFANFIVKDVIYYFILWILPFVAGFFFSSLFLSINLMYSAMLLLTLTLSFMIGLSVIFLLSTIYAHSARLLVCILLAGLGIFLLFIDYLNAGITWLPSFAFFIFPSMDKLIASLVLIAVPSYLSLVFMKIDYSEKKRTYENRFDKLEKMFSFSKQGGIMAKDYIDLKRSEGGLGKIIFSFLLPIAFIWLILHVFMRFFPQINLFVIFSVLLGVISSSAYNWLTEFDVFTSYSFLPIRVSDVIGSKVFSYILINIVSLAIFIMAMITLNGEALFLPSLAAFASISAYALAVNIYLTGLHPNALLYNAKIFLQYIAMLIPVLLIMIFLSVFSPALAIAGIVMIPVSYGLIKKSFRKWNQWEYSNY